MKTRLLIIIGTVFALTLFSSLMIPTFAVHTGEGNHPTPSPLSNMTPKDQLLIGIEPENIECKYGLELIQKYDGSPACVKPETKTKLIERGWGKADSTLTPSVFEVLKDDEIFDVEYSIKGGIVQDMMYDTDANLMLVTMNATDKGSLTITMPRTLIDSRMDYCPPQKENPPDDAFFVLVNEGVYDFGIGYKEIFHKEILTTSESRTLQIPFLQNATSMEIIGNCYI